MEGRDQEISGAPTRQVLKKQGTIVGVQNLTQTAGTKPRLPNYSVQHGQRTISQVPQKFKGFELQHAVGCLSDLFVWRSSSAPSFPTECSPFRPKSRWARDLSPRERFCLNYARSREVKGICALRATRDPKITSAGSSQATGNMIGSPRFLPTLPLQL